MKALVLRQETLRLERFLDIRAHLRGELVEPSTAEKSHGGVGQRVPLAKFLQVVLLVILLQALDELVDVDYGPGVLVDDVLVEVELVPGFRGVAHGAGAETLEALLVCSLQHAVLRLEPRPVGGETRSLQVLRHETPPLVGHELVHGHAVDGERERRRRVPSGAGRGHHAVDNLPLVERDVRVRIAAASLGRRHRSG